MSDLQANIYATVSIDRVKVTLDKLHKFYYVLEYKDQKFSSSENPVKTQEIQWTDLRFTFKLDENEAKTASFKFQLWGPATKLKRSDFVIAEANVSFKDFLAKHAPNFEPVEREPQYNFESVFMRKGKEHGSLLFSSEVTGWKVIDDMLKSEDDHTRERAFQNLKLLSTTKNPKLNQYIRAETFQTINEAIKRSIKPSKKVKSPRKDSEKLIEEEKPVSNNKDENKNDPRKAYLELWELLCKIDVNMRTKLITLGALQVIKKFIKCSDIEVQLHFLEMLKQFFTLAAHQKEIIKEGLLKKLISLVTADELRIQMKAFEILLYFDEVHQPEMIRLGLVGKLISLLKHANPSVQAKALEIIQYFDAKHQDLLISTGALKELTDLIKLDPKDAFTHGLILKTLSVISHFDVPHQREILEQQMHVPLLELLKLESEKIKLKTLSVIEGFDPSYGQQFMDAGLLQFINILLDDNRISIKTKAFETVTKLKHHTAEIIQVGILDRLLNLMNDPNAVLQMNAFEFVQKFPATQQQLIDAGVLKNVNTVLKSSLTASSSIISAALEFLITFEPAYYTQIINSGILESVLAIMAQKINWHAAPFNKILGLCFKIINLIKENYEDEIVSKKAYNVFVDLLKPGGQKLDETTVFDVITSFKKWRQHLNPVLQSFLVLLLDVRDKVRKGVIAVIEKYPSEEHSNLLPLLVDILLNSLLVASQNAIIAQTFFNLITSMKNYQEELYKTQARYEKLINIAKVNESKRVQVLDLFSQLEESIKPKVLKYNLIGNLLEFAAVAPSGSKYSGAKLLDMITSFEGWKEALLELKALKNLTDFLNNPVRALQIKAMDLLEEFSAEKQVAMMQEGLVQALLQTVVVNEDTDVQSRALVYLSNISHHPTFMEIMCTSKEGSIIDGFTVRMDKSTAHPSIVMEDNCTKISVDATKQTYANWCTCYGLEAMTKGVKCWEMVIESNNMNNFMVGVCNKNQRNTEYLGQNVNGWALYYSSGSIYFYHGGNSQLHKTLRLNKGDTIGLIYDAENGQLEMYVKDEYVGIVYGAISGDIYPAVSLYNNTDVVCFRAAPQLAVKREMANKEEQTAMNPIEAEVINQWIGTGIQGNWFLSYRASVHGWNTRNFHARCDFKGPTITIVRTADAVFGGYSSMPWASTGGYKRDSNAFLFSLKNPHNSPPSKHPLYRNQQNSVYHDTSSGPTFGGGFDLYINLTNKEASYSNLGFSYQNANPNPPGVNAAYYFTGRNSQWGVNDVEVYLQQKPKRIQRKLLLYQFVRTIEIVKPAIANKFKEILFAIAGKKPVYKKYLLAVVQKILSEPGLLKPTQVTLEELKAGFGASGIELLPYRVVSINGKKEVPAKDLAKQDGKCLESDTEELEVVLEVLPKKTVKADKADDSSENNTNNTNTNTNNNNNNSNTNAMPVDQQELPYITHFIVSAPIKELSDKFSPAKDVMCFLSNDEPDSEQLAKFKGVKFDDPAFEFKELLDLKAEKVSGGGGQMANMNESTLLDLDEKPEEETVGANNNNNVVDDKNDEELKALKKFLRELKLGIHKPAPPPPEVQTNQYGYVFVNEANERVRYKDQAMVDLSQFANGVITYRVEYLANGNFEWLPDSTAVEDVIEVPPRPKKEVKDEAKEREEKERIEKLEHELEEKEREEKERKERELKERGEQDKKTPEQRDKDRVAAILAELRRDEADDVETQTLQKIEEPYKPVAVIELDSLAEKPLKQATMARYVTVKVLRSAKASTCATLNHIALVGFFKSANKQPLPPPTTMVDVSKRFGFFKEGIKVFNYVSDGDTNGVIYWIGTQDGKSSSWSNPADSKRVTVTTSHPMFNTWMKPELILDRGSIVNYWGSDLPIYFTLDMQSYEVYITHFTIRHAHSQAYGYIQNFTLSGSKDGVTWVQLFDQAACPFNKPHDAATLTVPEGQDFFRYFRLTQRTSYKDSPNFTGGPFMFVSGFEVYGTMRYFN